MAMFFLRDIDDDEHRLLKSRAAKDGLTVKIVLLKLIALYIRGKVKLV